MSFLSKIFSPIGEIVGGIFGASHDEEVSRQSAKDQMAFQQYNSDTAYQRAVKDLNAAGLNPILAAFNGGASTPSGAGYSSNYVGATNSAVSLASALGSLKQQSVQNANTRANTDLVKAQINNVNANTANTAQDTINKTKAFDKLSADIESVLKGSKLTDTRIQEIQQNMRILKPKESLANTAQSVINGLQPYVDSGISSAQGWLDSQFNGIQD